MNGAKRALMIALVGIGCLASAAGGYALAPALARAGIVPTEDEASSPCHLSVQATGSTVAVSFEVDSAADLAVTVTDAAGVVQHKDVPFDGASQGQLTFENVAPGESSWQAECMADGVRFEDGGSVNVEGG